MRGVETSVLALAEIAAVDQMTKAAMPLVVHLHDGSSPALDPTNRRGASERGLDRALLSPATSQRTINCEWWSN
jgi:hypothetical protein